MIKTFFYLLFDFLGPPRCLGCDRLGRYFCAECLAEAEYINRQKCPVCEQPSVGGATHPSCRGRYTLDGLFSLFEYKKIIRRAITFLKYKHVTHIKDELERLINYMFSRFYEEDYLRELEDFIVFDRPFVIPIPLHWLRRTTRGFNQAEFLGEIFAGEYERPLFTDLLYRKKYTSQQTKLRGKERRNNVKKAFGIKQIYKTQKTKLKNGKIVYKLDKNLQNILLVDDVVTTGSTLASAANTLKREGAKKVWAITLAA